MPSLYQSTLNNEYLLAHEECGLEPEDLIVLARRSIVVAGLDAERKDAFLRRFEFEVPAAQSKL